MKLDFLKTIDEAEYHSATGARYLSSHLLMLFMKSPSEYYNYVYLGKKPYINPKAAVLGTATHKLVLEGEEEFNKCYYHNKFRSNSVNYCKLEEDNKGKSPLSDSDIVIIRGIKDSVDKHPIAGKMFLRGKAEGVIEGEIYGTMAHGRFDYVTTKGNLIDLKTCQDLDKFSTDFVMYRYVYQLAFYRELLSLHVDMSDKEVYVVAAEKNPPYRVGVWNIKEHVLNIANEKNRLAAEELAYITENNSWVTKYNDMQYITGI